MRAIDALRAGLALLRKVRLYAGDVLVWERRIELAAEGKETLVVNAVLARRLLDVLGPVFDLARKVTGKP